MSAGTPHTQASGPPGAQPLSTQFTPAHPTAGGLPTTDLDALVSELRARLPAALHVELARQVDEFQARLQLLEARAQSSAARPVVDAEALRGDLYDLLKDDLVYFLLKILKRKYVPAPGIPLLPAHLRREIQLILRELKVYIFNPAAKDFSRESILERWYAGIAAESPLSVQAMLDYFAIYRNRLYSLGEDRPYVFATLAALVRHFLNRPEPGLSFARIFRAELRLRDEIQSALYERYRTQSRRLDYLVACEIIAELSNNFLTELHTELEVYYRSERDEERRLRSEAQRQKATLDAEIKQAARLQNKILQKELPAHPHLDFALWFEPYSGVGGDFYRVLRLEEDVYGLFLADITGHGLGAALHLPTLANCFDRLVDHYHSPERLLTRMNEELYGQLRDHFVTAIYVRLDLGRGLLDYSNAGHPKGFLAALGDPEKRVRFLRPNGKVLGSFRVAEFRQETVELYDACRLILYTDGLSEAMDPRANFLGERGFLDMFDGTTDWDTPATLAHIQAAISAFQSGAPPEDDRSLLITDMNLRSRV